MEAASFTSPIAFIACRNAAVSFNSFRNVHTAALFVADPLFVSLCSGMVYDAFLPDLWHVWQAIHTNSSVREKYHTYTFQGRIYFNLVYQL